MPNNEIIDHSDLEKNIDDCPFVTPDGKPVETFQEYIDALNKGKNKPKEYSKAKGQK